MAPSYKLTYLNLTALGEPIRWLLAYNNIDFEDFRMEKDVFVAKYKDSAPFGKLPILEIGDGKKYTQSAAISRFLAKKANILGKTDVEALQADIIVDTFADFRSALVDYFFDANPVTKEAKVEPLYNTTIPYFLSRFDKIVAENNGYFVNGQLTWADIFYVAHIEFLEFMAAEADFWTNYPSLVELRDKVRQIPQIKAWIAKRPKSN